MRAVNLLAFASTLLWIPHCYAQKDRKPDGLWAGWPSCVLDCAEKSPACNEGPVRDCVCPDLFAACYRLLACKDKDAATVGSMIQPICERRSSTPPTSAATSPSSLNTSSQLPIPTSISLPVTASTSGNATVDSPSQSLPLIPSPALSNSRVPSSVSNTNQYHPVTSAITPSLPLFSASSSSISPVVTGTGSLDTTNKERSNSNPGAIAGGVIGGIIGLAILIALVLVLRRRTRAAITERETVRELERDVPEPPPVEDDEVYGYGYGAGTATGYPLEKAHPLHLDDEYGGEQAQQPQYGYGHGYGFPDEKRPFP